MTRLAGKSALITGSARGIGLGFAERFIAEGATVAIADINLEAAQATAKALGDSAYAVQLDVSDQASIDPKLSTFPARPMTSFTRSMWRGHCSRCRPPPNR